MSSQEFARLAIRGEAEVLGRLAELIDARFERAVQLVLACTGSVVVTGVGKPWLIGQKISATMASTGTPSFALHPTEAAHGDLGRVRPSDVVLALSNSGSSEEVVRLLPLLKRDGVPIIGVTGRPESELGRYSDVVLELGRIEEVCPLNLAPSASTTAMLALGDALALAVMERRGFKTEDYARFHPAGALGRKLMRIEEIMRPLAETPTVKPRASVKEALLAITGRKAGAAFIVGPDNKLLGVFTDGDLRRHLDTPDILAKPIEEVMTRPGLRIAAGELATAALHMMQERRVAELPIVDGAGMLLGHIQLKDLLAAKMF